MSSISNLITFRAFACIAVGVLLQALPVIGDSNGSDEVSVADLPLNALVRIQNLEEHRAILALVSSVRMLRAVRRTSPLSQLEETGVNFVFVGADDAIVDRNINPKVIDFLRENTVELVTAAPSQTDECHIQKAVFQDKGSTTIGIYDNDESRAGSELIFQCFAIALHYHFHGSVEEVTPLRWRQMIIDIVSR